MNREQCQSKTEDAYCQVRGPQRLHLLQLQASNQLPRRVRLRPWNSPNSRGVEGHVEVRPRVESGKVSVPSFHVAGCHCQMSTN
jgi:hypothetical protein